MTGTGIRIQIHGNIIDPIDDGLGIVRHSDKHGIRLCVSSKIAHSDDDRVLPDIPTVEHRPVRGHRSDSAFVIRIDD